MSSIRIAIVAALAVVALLAGGASGHHTPSQRAPVHAALTSAPRAVYGPVPCCQE